MKRLKLFLGFSLSIAVSLGLSGCFITGASPDPSETVYINQGESREFRIEGPEETDTLYYKWVVNAYDTRGGGYRDELQTQPGGREFELQTQPDADITNKLRVSCNLIKVSQYYEVCIVTQYCTPGWKTTRDTINSRHWYIEISQDPPVWSGDYIAEDQDDLASLTGFTEVTGDLFIGGWGTGLLSSFKITNLQDLSSLTTVGGNLIIREQGALASLSGLNNLTSIGGGLEIETHLMLSDLTALNGITSIPGDLSIVFNEALSELDGLNNISTIGGDLAVCGNDALENLNGLNNVASIGKDLSIGFPNSVFGNDSLTSLGLDSLNSVGYSFDILHNTNLPTSLAEDLRSGVTVGLKTLICGNLDGEPCP